MPESDAEKFIQEVMEFHSNTSTFGVEKNVPPMYAWQGNLFKLENKPGIPLHTNFSNVNFTNIDTSGVDFHGVNLENSIFPDPDHIQGADFSGATLRNTFFGFRANQTADKVVLSCLNSQAMFASEIRDTARSIKVSISTPTVTEAEFGDGAMQYIWVCNEFAMLDGRMSEAEKEIHRHDWGELEKEKEKSRKIVVHFKTPEEFLLKIKVMREIIEYFDHSLSDHSLSDHSLSDHSLSVELSKEILSAFCTWLKTGLPEVRRTNDFSKLLSIYKVTEDCLYSDPPLLDETEAKELLKSYIKCVTDSNRILLEAPERQYWFHNEDDGPGMVVKLIRVHMDDLQEKGGLYFTARKSSDGKEKQTILTRLFPLDLGLGVVSMHKSGKASIVIARGSVVDFTGDAIVNAANTGGLDGGGVDDAINDKGGDGLKKAREEILINENGRRIEVGEAVTTIGGDLTVDHVIHAVGPNFKEAINEGENGKTLLHKAYCSALREAARVNCHSVAFSLLSAGIFRGGKTLDYILGIARDALLDIPPPIQRVFLVGYTQHEVEALQRVFANFPKE